MPTPAQSRDSVALHSDAAHGAHARSPQTRAAACPQEFSRPAKHLPMQWLVEKVLLVVSYVVQVSKTHWLVAAALVILLMSFTMPDISCPARLHPE